MDIAMQPVTSSQIAQIGYDADSETLAIRFNPNRANAEGSVYHYANVPAKVWEDLQAAESKGSFFIHNIKNDPARYPYTKIS